jgi:hypothetical protein
MTARLFALASCALLASSAASARAQSNHDVAMPAPNSGEAPEQIEPERTSPASAATDDGRDPGVVQFRLAPTYRHLYDIPVYGVDFGAAIGRWTARHDRYLSLDGFIGRTEYGLRVSGGFLDYRTYWTFDRLRLGYAVGPGVLIVQSATGASARSSMAIKTSLLLGCDLAKVGPGVLAVEGSFDFDTVPGNDTTFFWGPTLAAAWRL